MPNRSAVTAKGPASSRTDLVTTNVEPQTIMVTMRATNARRRPLTGMGFQDFVTLAKAHPQCPRLPGRFCELSGGPRLSDWGYANFSERRKAEVQLLRTSLPRRWVNKPALLLATCL